MDDRKRILDLTMFDRRTFAGKFRLRYLFEKEAIPPTTEVAGILA